MNEQITLDEAYLDTRKNPYSIEKIRCATVDGPTLSPTPKKVNGVVYDITKSVLVASEGSGSYEEQVFEDNLEFSDLYRTNDGHWFAYCTGGSNTRWNTEVGEDCFQGYAIIPLTQNEVREWLATRYWSATDKQLRVLKKHFKDMFAERD